MDTAARTEARSVAAAETTAAGPPQWFAVYTRARHEKIVARELDRRGLQVLLPLYRAVRRWKNRHRSLELPLFPSYVFVNAGLRQRLRILTAPGCVYLVSDSQGPLSIPPAEMASVEILVAAARRGASVGPCAFLRSGARVRVVQGPLEGLEGILEDKRRPEAVVVSVTALGSSIRVEVPAEDVEPI